MFCSAVVLLVSMDGTLATTVLTDVVTPNTLFILPYLSRFRPFLVNLKSKTSSSDAHPPMALKISFALT